MSIISTTFNDFIVFNRNGLYWVLTVSYFANKKLFLNNWLIAQPLQFEYVKLCTYGLKHIQVESSLFY